MQKTNIEKLMEMAIVVEEGTMAIRPSENKKVVFNPTVDQMENCFNSNSGIVAFVKGGKMYVIPFMAFVMETLKQFNFKRKTMVVPFSNNEYPVEQKSKWDKLLKMVEEERYDRFLSDCEKYADKHGYMPIADHLLTDYCLEVPQGGIHYIHFQKSDVVYPEVSGSSFDSTVANCIGKYCIVKGICSFVYRNGRTYITKSNTVISALQSAGYRLGSLNVPFTKGEIITDTVPANKWKNIA